MYTISQQESDDLKNRFSYHQPKGDQTERFQELRIAAFKLAENIMHEVPPGRERALALTNLEQAIFWANAGIARGE